MDVRACVQEKEQEIIALRRAFHRHPEVSGRETDTLLRIHQELTAAGIWHKTVAGGGMIGVIEGTGEGRSLLLRSDIDALPMEENPQNLKREKTVCSQVPGAAHTCGHDGHMAMLLGAAKILQENRDQFAGRVVLAFEAAEETGNGIVPLMEELFTLGRIDGSWGIHLLSELPVGKISVDPGPRTTTPIHFGVKIIGKGGHASRPDQCINPLDVFMDIYQGTNHLLAVEASPFYPVKHGIGVIDYGTVTNIIPDTLTYQGSFRVLHFEELGVPLHDAYFKMVDSICRRYGAGYEIIKDLPMDMAVVNDPACCKLAEDAIAKVLGEGFLTSHHPWFASESMGVIQKYWPGVFAFVGIANEEQGSGAAHHSPFFDLDERALLYGAAATVQYAMDFLRETTPIPHPHPGKTPAQLLGMA